MSLRLVGIKEGMMQIFDKVGNRVVCTVIKTDKHLISQIKTEEKDGYHALQLAGIQVSKAKLRNVKKPQFGHFKKAGIEPRKILFEARLNSEETSYKVGQEVGLGLLDEVSFVDIQGMSKGKGYQGVMKRHNFAGGPAAHGSGFHRHGGSCGMRSTPGRCLPGQKKAGRMGGECVTTQNLKIVRVDKERQILLVEGSVPGCRGGYVYITPAKKKATRKSEK